MAESVLATGIKYGLYPVAKIEENPWNMNVMPADKYEAVCKDMKRGGPTAIDPILIVRKRIIFKDPSIPEDLYIVIGGNHRLRLAKELGWLEIRAEQDPTIDSEERARVISYIKNAEHGEMNPYLLADYFQWFIDEEKLTHEEIAKIHNINRTTVTKTLSLIKIEPEARGILANVPRVTISHLEPIATLKPKQQRKYAKELKSEYRGGHESPSVRTIEHEVSRIKREEQEAEELGKAVQKAKFPKCPTCGKPPEKRSYQNLPWVHCPSYHEWSLEAGLPKREPPIKREKGKPQLPKYVRMTHTVDDFRRVFGEYARAQVPKIKEINDLSCRGEKDHIHADLRGSIVSLSVDVGGKKFFLHAEPKSYASKALQQFKTSVSVWPEPNTKKDLVELEQLVEELFEKFGGKEKR